jgi:hypothetical protein
MVAGVRDDLSICGVTMESKRFDMLALHIDDIWHSSIIVHEDGSKLAVGSVKAELRKFAGHSLIVISIARQEGRKYKLKNGEFWVRLSASNYCVVESQLIEPHTVDNMIKQREELVKSREVSAAHHRENELRKQYNYLLRNCQAEIAIRRASEGRAMKLLMQKILNEKKQKEADLAAAARSSWIVTMLGQCFSWGQKTAVESVAILDLVCGAEKC